MLKLFRIKQYRVFLHYFLGFCISITYVVVGQIMIQNEKIGNNECSFPLSAVSFLREQNEQLKINKQICQICDLIEIDCIYITQIQSSCASLQNVGLFIMIYYQLYKLCIMCLIQISNKCTYLQLYILEITFITMMLMQLEYLYMFGQLDALYNRSSKLEKNQSFTNYLYALFIIYTLNIFSEIIIYDLIHEIEIINKGVQIVFQKGINQRPIQFDRILIQQFRRK